MRRNRWFLSSCPVLLISAWLIACAGGSGSSGFDISFTESAAISEALMAQRCVEVTDTQLTVCPADVTSPSGGVGSVETGVDRSSALPCVPTDAGQCGFVLPFMTEGLPPTSHYRVATRAAQGDAHWRMTPVAAATPMPGAPSFDVPVSFERPIDAPGASTAVQVAILVYLSEPDVLPNTVPSLVASGADFAYVISTIEVSLLP